MAISMQLAKRFLSDSSLIKSLSAFSTSAVCRSGTDEKTPAEILASTGEVIVVNPIEEPKKLPYVEQRKMEDELVPHYVENMSFISGIPQEHVVERLARIAKVPKNAMQSGTDNTQAWVIRFDNRERWENDLIGWVSTGDPLSNVEIRFNNPEEAVDYCKRYHYPYFVVKEKPSKLKKKSYANIFSWNKRSRSSTK